MTIRHTLYIALRGCARMIGVVVHLDYIYLLHLTSSCWNILRCANDITVNQKRVFG
jgi:hypothetical protein